MADSEVRQKFEAWLREELLLLGASPHLVIARLARTAPMRVFDYADDSTEFKWRGFQAGMRAGKIAQREQAVFLAAKLLPVHMAKRLIAALPLPAAPNTVELLKAEVRVSDDGAAIKETN